MNLSVPREIEDINSLQTMCCQQGGSSVIIVISGHFGSRSIGASLYSMSVATSNIKLIGAFLIKL